MLAVLWLIVWATVGDAFYDDYNWYTSDDGVTYGTAETQKEIRENFTDTLRSFADSYIPKREGEEELTMQKVKSRLRMVKVFSHTGNSNDFESNKGQALPLSEGGRFCTMGRHTKVDCNHCTCVAGQLYMCTGMICHKAPEKPRSDITCKEGKRRKIDACNYCYCRNGHEICSTKDCRHQHDHLRTRYTCTEGVRRKVACNRCICRNGEEYCTNENCAPKKPTQLKLKLDNLKPEGHCNDGQTLKIDCRACKCTKNRWRCSEKNCAVKHKPEKLLWPKCKEGTTRQLDACNTCYCRLGREFCEKKNCDEEEHLQFYRNLKHDEIQCDEGSYRKVDACNYCLCLNGTDMCTMKTCPENDLGFLRRRQDCDRWDVKYEKCNRCVCLARRWVCTQNPCEDDAAQELETSGERGLKNNDNYFYLEVCNSGQKRKLDVCNTCFCLGGQWFCQIQECKERSNDKIPKAMKISEVKKSDIIQYFKNLDEEKTSIVHNIFEQLATNEHGDNTYPVPNNINMIPIDILDAIESLFSEISESTENNEDNENVGLNGKDIKLIGRFNGENTLFYVEKDEPAEEPACKKGSRKKIQCNQCFCRKGIWLCQNKNCGPDMGALPPNCKRGDKIMVDCVPCKCRRRGWKCNIRKKKRNCKLDEKKPPAVTPDLTPVLRIRYRDDDDDDGDHLNLTKRCKIGERYRVDLCNYCYCNAHRERICSNNKCIDHHLPQGDDRFPMNITEKQCKLGTKFRQGECNYCYCNYDHQLVCSKNQCRRKLRTGLSDDKQVLRFTPAPKICLPHERFRYDNCNWCYCNETRHRVCERNPCNRTTPDPSWPPNSPRRGCYIGSRFSWGECGYCYCTVWRKIRCLFKLNCTEGITTTTSPRPIVQAPEHRTRPRSSLHFECEVGQIERIDNCNYCRCTFSRKWMCSDKACRSNNKHHNFLLSKTKLCTDGIRRQVDACNYCVCHTGVEFCTKKTCSRDTVSTMFSQPECIVGDPVPAPDPCNLCICLDSNILCTDNPCIQRQSPANKDTKCVEGHKYRMKDGCNFCLCEGGQEFCTNRACLVLDDDGSESAGCNEGEVTSAGDSCNLCVCMTGKTVCTNKNCNRRKLGDAISESLLSYIRTKKNKKHKMTESTKRRCSPGQNYLPDDFDPKCPNDCICDRHELLCTKRKCFNNWDKKTPFKWPLGRVEVKNRYAKHFSKQDCVEYEKMQSIDRCNTCMCLNGRKVCTIVECADNSNKGQPGSLEALITNNNPRGNKGNKGNMKKKNNSFCEPFTFFSPDNNRFCRNCFCLHNGLALCLLNLCKYSKDIPHQNSPEELNEVCSPGEIGYPTKCVTCTCSLQGEWICTREKLALCQERDCDEKDEFHMGFSPYCAGCKCSVKEWFCSIQGESCSDYSNATCPQGSFIRNPRQHCSICLCGGFEEGSQNMCFTEAKCVRQVISQLRQ